MKKKVDNKIIKPHIKELSLYFIVFATFFILDIFLKLYTIKNYNYYSIFKLPSLIFTVIWSMIYTAIIFLQSFKSRKYVYLFLSSFWLVIAFAQLMMLKTKDSFITIYDLNLSAEAISYIDFILPNITNEIIIFIILLVNLLIFTFIKLKNIKNTKNIKFKLYTFFCSISIFAVGWIISVNLYSVADEKYAYYAYEYDYTFYEELSDPIKTLELTGLYQYVFLNVKDYIKSKLSNNKKNIISIEQYLTEQININEKNKYTETFKGKNLVLIQVESLEIFNITKKIMPTLYSIMSTGWNFSNFYNHQPGAAGTLDSEFVTQNGLNQLKNISLNILNYNRSLANAFKNEGYTANSFHNNKGIFYNRKTLHEKMGFTKHYSLKDLYNEVNIYNDQEMINNLKYSELMVPIQKENFYSFIVTISAHGPYNNNYFCSSEINNEISEQECFQYLSKKTDDFLNSLINSLKEKELLDNTVIIIYSDHYSYSYNPTDKEKLYYSYYSPKIRNIPLIIWSNNIKRSTFSEPLNMSDLTPTIMNLFGINYNTNNYIGSDYFSNNHHKFAYFKDNTWYDGNMLIKYDQEQVDNSHIFNLINNKNYYNNLIIKNNYYKE